MHGGTYKYTPLQDGEIRLLHLLAGSDNEPIRCTFSAHKLDKTIEEFHALSYFWERQPPLNSIEIINGNHSQPWFEATLESVFIRPTLHSALRRLRDHCNSTVLWIDALCINQLDDVEKQGQVVMMPRIFLQAVHVCVWLGEAADDSEALHTFLPKLLNLSHVDEIVDSESTPEQWQAFAALMMRRWFNRRWIIQELIYSEFITLYCGRDFSIAWPDFCDAVALFGEKFNAVREIFRRSSKYMPHFICIRMVKRDQDQH